jgi:general stress protein 26
MQNANDPGTQEQKGDDATQGGEAGTFDELYALLKEFDTAMLVTQTPEGYLRARPMAIQDPNALESCDLWFMTSEEAPKVNEIEQERQVAVSCYRPRDRAYLSISARARIERNPAIIQKVWKPEFQAWMPNGPEQAAVLKLTLERAEYWEPTGGALRVLYEKAKALVTRTPAAKDLDPVKHVSG